MVKSYIKLHKVLFIIPILLIIIGFYANCNSNSVTVVGTQFGDESKGKIVDFLTSTENVDVVARFNGGANAGHTIIVNDKNFKLHLVPSGILNPSVLCVLGAGTAINMEALLDEIAMLKSNGIDVSENNLKISSNAIVVLPLHKITEALNEKTNNLNTTKQGNGPAYEDRAGRRAILIGDLVGLEDKEKLNFLEQRVVKLLSHHNALYKGHGTKEISKEDVMSYLKKYANEISIYVSDVVSDLYNMQNQDKKFLIEGAQGTWLDLMHGAYPYVTSSTVLATAADYSLGFALKDNNVIGVVKAYSTKVGNGPFPTILNDADGEKMQSIGKEFGTTTGRKRDCGWLDLVLLKHSIIMNGISGLALAKGDVLDGFSVVKICIGYDIDGKRIYTPPVDMYKWKNIKPIYKEFKGWKNTRGITDFNKLDKHYKEFIDFIEKETGVPVVIVSTGPDRTETIVRQNPYEINKN